MVFTRSVKASIKRTLAKSIFAIAIVFVLASIIINAAFARTAMDIPVEVNWTDQGSNYRPSSVTLRLMDGSTEVSNITLTASDADPSDSDKWVGVFASVPESSNYTIVEDNVNNYGIIANNIAPNIDHNIAVSNTQNVTSTSSNNLGATDFVLIVSSNSYYLWTRDSYAGTDYSQLLSALYAMVGSSFTLNNSNYTTTLPTTFSIYDGIIFNESVTLSQSNNNVSFSHSGTTLLGNRFRSYYYGEIVPATSGVVSFTNVRNSTFTLTVHHLNEDNTTFAADVVTTYNSGDTYAASPISNNRYTSEITIGQATGTINQDIEVTYVYHPKYHDVIYQFTGSVQPPNASTLLPATAEHEVGTTVTVAQGPTAAGYRFLGWQINGSPAGASFTMPTSDVVVTGSWEQFNGYFAPTLAKQVINPQTIYRFGDTVQFQITVTNTASFPITNVEVKENLLGATFVISPNYTVSNTGDIATIATIPANSSITLTAEYPITDDVTQTGRTNTVEITAASANNYYFLDPNQSYTASTTFNTQSWQDVPVLTGINISQATTLLYAFLLAIGAIGLAGAVVAYCGKEEDKE